MKDSFIGSLTHRFIEPNQDERMNQ